MESEQQPSTTTAVPQDDTQVKRNKKNKGKRHGKQLSDEERRDKRMKLTLSIAIGSLVLIVIAIVLVALILAAIALTIIPAFEAPIILWPNLPVILTEYYSSSCGLSMTWLCDAAYFPMDVIQPFRAMLSLHGWGDMLDNNSIERFQGPQKIGAGFIGIFRDNNVMIAFQGTGPGGTNQVLADIDFELVPFPDFFPADTGVKVSQGFKNGWEDAQPFIDSYLGSIASLIDGSTRFWITGHSLGGAISTLCGCYLWRKFETEFYGGSGAPQVIIYSFASPAVGNQEFVTYFNDVLGQVNNRVRNATDIIPSLPPAHLGYVQTKTQILLNTVEPTGIMTCGYDAPEPPEPIDPEKYAISHDLTTYQVLVFQSYGCANV